MKISKRIFVLSLVIMIAASLAYPQSKKIDINALIEETQKTSPNKDEMTIVWWIPLEFWEASLSEEKLPKAQIDELIGMLRPYVLVAVVDGKVGADGTVKYRTGSAIASTIRIVGHGKTELRPLADEKVGPGMTAVLGTMKPVVQNVLGSIGTNLHFVVFPSSEAGGSQIVDPKKGGMFAIRLDSDRTFSWRLPLASLSPPKICPVDGEKLPANWKYCPFHGSELKE